MNVDSGCDTKHGHVSHRVHFDIDRFWFYAYRYGTNGMNVQGESQPYLLLREVPRYLESLQISNNKSSTGTAVLGIIIISSIAIDIDRCVCDSIETRTSYHG